MMTIRIEREQEETEAQRFNGQVTRYRSCPEVSYKARYISPLCTSGGEPIRHLATSVPLYEMVRQSIKLTYQFLRSN